MSRILLHLACCLLAMPLLAQNVARISGSILLKEKRADGRYGLTSGNFYYDTRFKKIVYTITFPNRETWVTKDTSLYKIVNNRVSARVRNMILPQFSIFHIALNGQMTDFGLKNSVYKIEKVEKEDGMVVTTWKPSLQQNLLGKVMVSQKNKQLHGVVFFSPAGVVVAKQFYQKFVSVGGIAFPTEVVMISTRNGKEFYQVTKYDKLSVNDFSSDQPFDYPLPVR